MCPRVARVRCAMPKPVIRAISIFLVACLVEDVALPAHATGLAKLSLRCPVALEAFVDQAINTPSACTPTPTRTLTRTPTAKVDREAAGAGRGIPTGPNGEPLEERLASAMAEGAQKVASWGGQGVVHILGFRWTLGGEALTLPMLAQALLRTFPGLQKLVVEHNHIGILRPLIRQNPRIMETAQADRSAVPVDGLVLNFMNWVSDGTEILHLGDLFPQFRDWVQGSNFDVAYPFFRALGLKVPDRNQPRYARLTAVSDVIFVNHLAEMNAEDSDRSLPAWVALIQALIKDGRHVEINGGAPHSDSDSERVQSLREALATAGIQPNQYTVRNLSVLELMDYLPTVAGVITVDSGIFHLAGLWRIPSVVVRGGWSYKWVPRPSQEDYYRDVPIIRPHGWVPWSKDWLGFDVEAVMRHVSGIMPAATATSDSPSQSAVEPATLKGTQEPAALGKTRTLATLHISDRDGLDFPIDVVIGGGSCFSDGRIILDAENIRREANIKGLPLNLVIQRTFLEELGHAVDRVSQGKRSTRCLIRPDCALSRHLRHRPTDQLWHDVAETAVGFRFLMFSKSFDDLKMALILLSRTAADPEDKNHQWPARFVFDTVMSRLYPEMPAREYETALARMIVTERPWPALIQIRRVALELFSENFVVLSPMGGLLPSLNNDFSEVHTPRATARTLRQVIAVFESWLGRSLAPESPLQTLKRFVREGKLPEDLLPSASARNNHGLRNIRDDLLAQRIQDLLSDGIGTLGLNPLLPVEDLFCQLASQLSDPRTMLTVFLELHRHFHHPKARETHAMLVEVMRRAA